MKMKWLTHIFEGLGLGAKTPEPTYPDKMYSEVVSKPGAAIRVEVIHLTESQQKALTVRRGVFLPGCR